MAGGKIDAAAGQNILQFSAAEIEQVFFGCGLERLGGLVDALLDLMGGAENGEVNRERMQDVVRATDVEIGHAEWNFRQTFVFKKIASAFFL